MGDMSMGEPDLLLVELERRRSRLEHELTFTNRLIGQLERKGKEDRKNEEFEVAEHDPMA